ncbi:MAG: lactate racemase domain-containing protein [Acutalibacteraceae bacterium]
MAQVSIPFGQRTVQCQIPDDRLLGVLRPATQAKTTVSEQQEIVKQALLHPIGSPSLQAFSKDKNKILIITSDHTRPMPSKITMPLLLEQIRLGNPAAEIHILVATGFHRLTTQDELLSRFGREIVENETVLVHNARDPQSMHRFGTLPSGSALTKRGSCLGGSCTFRRLYRTSFFCRLFRRPQKHLARHCLAGNRFL